MIRGPLINWNLQVPHKVDIKDNYKQEQIAVNYTSHNGKIHVR